MKTPPPPIWGMPLEEDDYDGTEDFYNHRSAMQQLKEKKEKELVELEKSGRKTESQRAKILKLKRRVVYTYEYDDPSDNEKGDEVTQDRQSRGPILVLNKANLS